MIQPQRAVPRRRYALFTGALRRVRSTVRDQLIKFDPDLLVAVAAAFDVWGWNAQLVFIFA